MAKIKQPVATKKDAKTMLKEKSANNDVPVNQENQKKVKVNPLDNLRKSKEVFTYHLIDKTSKIQVTVTGKFCENGVLCFSASRCGKEEMFNRKEGRKRALQRLLNEYTCVNVSLSDELKGLRKSEIFLSLAHEIARNIRKSSYKVHPVAKQQLILEKMKNNQKIK